MDHDPKNDRIFCGNCGGETPHTYTLYGRQCVRCGKRRERPDADPPPRLNPPEPDGPENAT